jgi:type IV pilus assembly protein PilA
MVHRLCRRWGNAEGFSLIELLVVILIIGILAAIAIPAFLSQTSKANDSAAETQVGTLLTTMEAYTTDHKGSFVGASLTELQKIEPTLKDTSTATAAVVGTPSADTFEVSSTARGTGDSYTLKSEKGAVTRSCATGSGGNSGGGCRAGTW